MTIPDAAIEAAAEACPYLTPVGARAAIEAAMPAIREAIAQEITADADSVDHRFLDSWKSGMGDAAEIVRWGERKACPTCGLPQERPGEGRFCGVCQKHEGECADDHCMECGADT